MYIIINPKNAFFIPQSTGQSAHLWCLPTRGIPRVSQSICLMKRVLYVFLLTEIISMAYKKNARRKWCFKFYAWIEHITLRCVTIEWSVTMKENCPYSWETPFKVLLPHQFFWVPQPLFGSATHFIISLPIPSNPSWLSWLSPRHYPSSWDPEVFPCSWGQFFFKDLSYKSSGKNRRLSSLTILASLTVTTESFRDQFLILFFLPFF